MHVDIARAQRGAVETVIPTRLSGANEQPPCRDDLPVREEPEGRWHAEELSDYVRQFHEREHGVEDSNQGHEDEERNDSAANGEIQENHLNEASTGSDGAARAGCPCASSIDPKGPAEEMTRRFS